jgi:hypothetical protein
MLSQSIQRESTPPKLSESLREPKRKRPSLFVSAPGAVITRHRKKDGFLEIYTEGALFHRHGERLRRREANRKTDDTIAGRP